MAHIGLELLGEPDRSTILQLSEPHDFSIGPGDPVFSGVPLQQNVYNFTICHEHSFILAIKRRFGIQSAL